MKTVAIVLSAGSGKRMGSSIKKQYMEINDKPVIYYSLKTFEDSFIDEIILVTSKDDMESVRNEIVDKYNITKVNKIVAGGAQRYNSVCNGLNAIDGADYVFIHDGARPLVSQEILKRGLDEVIVNKACVIGVPSKDTVKIASPDGFVNQTPNRNLVWNIQTPQIFDFELIKEAYNYIVPKEVELAERGINITDDAMVLEEFNHQPIKLVMGSYENIKITTPEDIMTVTNYLNSK